MKKALALLLAVVMCLSVFALTGCDGNTNNTESSKNTENTENNGGDTQSGNSGSETAEVPTEAGKVTYYFTMTADSVAIPEHAGIFITGGAWGWATGEGSEMFTRLNDTNIYYLITDKNPKTEGATADQEYDFQLVVGLTQASGAASWGLQWNDSYKSAQCAEVAYPDNPKFEWAEGADKVNLGEHTFTAAPPAPVSVKTTLKATFTEALPEGAQVLVIGSLNGWNGEAMTSNDGGKTWELAVELLANEYEYKIKVYVPADNLAADFSNKWDCGTEYAADGGANAKVNIMEIDNGASITLMKELVYPVAG